MALRKWEDLPPEMQANEVRDYYEILCGKKTSLFLKRIFDMAASLLLLILLSPFFLILAVAIKVDSPGPVFFRQTRITQYGKPFRIFKFRTMIVDAEKNGTHVTKNHDTRITKVGNVIRKCRIDEIPQLFNVFCGQMSFVGTRPEVPQYVQEYTSEMLATLLLPAGVTSTASICYKDEARFLTEAENADEIYITRILPEKMEYNLRDIQKFSLRRDLSIMLKTVLTVLGRDYREELKNEVAVK